MNAQAEIVTSFSAQTSEGAVFVERGAIYDGTITSAGVFIFHVMSGGRVCEVREREDSPMLKITKFNANTTKE